jgi:hypothetical protein
VRKMIVFCWRPDGLDPKLIRMRQQNNHLAHEMQTLFSLQRLFILLLIKLTLGAFSRRNSFKTVSQLSDERTAPCFAPKVALRSGRSNLQHRSIAALPMERCLRLRSTLLKYRKRRQHFTSSSLHSSAVSR